MLSIPTFNRNWRKSALIVTSPAQQAPISWWVEALGVCRVQNREEMAQIWPGLPQESFWEILSTGRLSPRKKWYFTHFEWRGVGKYAVYFLTTSSDLWIAMTFLPQRALRFNYFLYSSYTFHSWASGRAWNVHYCKLMHQGPEIQSGVFRFIYLCSHRNSWDWRIHLHLVVFCRCFLFTLLTQRIHMCYP